MEANTSSISFSWDPPPGKVFMYRVKWSIGDGKEEEKSVYQPRAVLADLTPGTTYTITVAAVSGNQTGEAFTFMNVTGGYLLSSSCGLVVEVFLTSGRRSSVSVFIKIGLSQLVSGRPN